LTAHWCHGRSNGAGSGKGQETEEGSLEQHLCDCVSYLVGVV
jgi:hypothetical protein